MEEGLNHGDDNVQIVTYWSLVTISLVFLVSLVLIYAHMSRYFLALNFRFGSFPHVNRPFLLCTCSHADIFFYLCCSSQVYIFFYLC